LIRELTRIFKLTIFLALAAAPLAAQQPVLNLTLTQAQAYAVQHNPQILGAQFNAQAAAEVPLEFRSTLRPAISGAVTGVGADGGTRVAAGGLNNPVLYSRVASGVLGSDMITDFGRTNSLIASADFAAKAQTQVTETTKADILIAAASAYFGVLRANSVLSVAQQTVTARQLLSDQVTALFNSQLKSQLDVSFANVNLADARLLLSRAQNDVKSAEAQLALVMGLPMQTEFMLSEEPLPSELPAAVEPLIQQALQDRPELKDLRLEQNAADSFTKAEHDLSHPALSVIGAAGIVPLGDSKVPGIYSGIGVNVSIPILNGGLFHERQAQAELKAKAASARTDDVANRIARDVRVAYLNTRTAFERLNLTAQLLTQAQLSLELAQGRYDLGLSSIVELSQAQLNLTSAQIANVTARYDYQAQRAGVDYQIGALH